MWMMHAAVLRVSAFLLRHDVDLSPPLLAGSGGTGGPCITFTAWKPPPMPAGLTAGQSVDWVREQLARIRLRGSHRWQPRIARAGACQPPARGPGPRRRARFASGLAPGRGGIAGAAAEFRPASCPMAPTHTLRRPKGWPTSCAGQFLADTPQLHLLEKVVEVCWAAEGIDKHDW